MLGRRTGSWSSATGTISPSDSACPRDCRRAWEQATRHATARVTDPDLSAAVAVLSHFGIAMQITAAQHTGTGELCAFNELAIGTNPSETTHQWDTLVLREHRGHRLGMLVKTAGLRSWHARHPASSRVVTYNAEENRPMLSINEAIGFTPVAYEGAWKKELR